MSKTSYDIVKLEMLGEIDVGNAVKRFANAQEYFDELDMFVGMAKNYFSGYNPTFIMYDKDTRDGFLNEVVRTKNGLQSIGMTSLVSALSDLEHAVDHNSADTLADMIMNFCARAENIAKLIVSAQINADISDVSRKTKPIILAVDDKPELLTAIVNMLNNDYMVIAATSGKTALKIVETHTPRLFLLDIEMPEMDGYQLAQVLRARTGFTNIPIIFLTGKNTRDAVLTAMRNGGNDYIVKPVNRDILIEKVAKNLK